MDYSIEDRLKRLKNRRMDIDNTAMVFRGFVEDFDRRTNNQATRYALGAMQQVDHRSTEISLEEASRVEKALNGRMPRRNFWPEFRLQGSVPMNTHIRGASDVDLLEILGGTVTISPTGSRAHLYADPVGSDPIVDRVLAMRKATEEELSLHFHGANVDRSNAKSIQLTGGAFRRKVDVVPSYWHDSNDYQEYQNEIFRGVGVVDKNARSAIINYPFLFRHCIDRKGAETNDGAKMAIRLLKNLSEDSERERRVSSYDIAGIVYHCPAASITREVARDLAILSGISRFLNMLVADRATAETLVSPDRTRKIFDEPGKWRSFEVLAKNTAQLAREVERELVGPRSLFDRPYEEVLKQLNDSKIAPVPTF